MGGGSLIDVGIYPLGWIQRILGGKEIIDLKCTAIKEGKKG